MLPDNNRFPRSGGYVLDAAVPYRIHVTGQDSSGEDIVAEVGGGPVKFSAGAIVDFDVSV